jgi:hypothetical protein
VCVMFEHVAIRKFRLRLRRRRLYFVLFVRRQTSASGTIVPLGTGLFSTSTFSVVPFEVPLPAVFARRVFMFVRTTIGTVKRLPTLL